MVRTVAQLAHQIIALLRTDFIRAEWIPTILAYVVAHYDVNGAFIGVPEQLDSSIRTLECRDCSSDERGSCPDDCPVKPYRGVVT